jgi:hypothetical protein
LESLKVQAQSFQLGGGFSRLKLKKLGLFGDCLGIEHLTLTIPTLERLTMRGLVCDLSLASTGLVYTKLRHLECPVYMMPVVQYLPLLESLVLNAGQYAVTLPDTFSLAHLDRLWSIRLKGGHWTNALHWLPSGLSAFKCVSCTLHSFPAVLDLDHLLLVSCVFSTQAAASLAGVSVSHLTFYTLGVPTPGFSIRCTAIDSPVEDIKLITILGSRPQDSTEEIADV